MAESEEATNPTPEEPKLEESKPMPAPAASQEDEKAQASKSQEAEKAPAAKADAAAKPAKKPAKQKKEQPAAGAGASANLSLSADEVEKPKVVKGNVIGWSSAGKVGFKGSRKSTAYAAQMVAQDASRQAMGHGLKEVEVLVRGPGAGRESAVRALQAVGLDLTIIRDVTPVPHNGCRPPKQRRV